MVKPKIRNLNLSDEQVEQLNQTLTDTKKPKQTRINMVKDVTDGFCFSCHKVPTKVVRWELGGIQVVERYCSSCYENNEKRIINNDRFC